MENSNSGKPNIVIVGHIVIDHNKTEKASYVRWGSPAMFMRQYFRSNFAINPTIIASYGDDFLQFASDTILLPKQPNLEKSIVFENIYTQGPRIQYCHNEKNILPEITQDVIDSVSKADLLFLATLTTAYTKEYVDDLMQHANPNCLKVLSPQGYFRTIAEDGLVSTREFEEAAEIVPNFDLMIISDEDYPEADRVAHEWKHFSPKTNIIVTENARGADIILENGVQHVPTNPVTPEDAVDPTGLGDVFTAATSLKLLQSRNLEEAVKAGHVAAREKLLSPIVR
ncbi:MAG TPA: carbohydrate kinase family protein [Candidatus Saccharimonadales bacterium]|nr:carbohydrate kinase family protein [Candidatus Saccharimonadales bacterium]